MSTFPKVLPFVRDLLFSALLASTLILSACWGASEPPKAVKTGVEKSS